MPQQQPVFFGPKPILFGLVRFYFSRWHCWKPMRRCYKSRGSKQDSVAVCDNCGFEINISDEEQVTMGGHLL